MSWSPQRARRAAARGQGAGGDRGIRAATVLADAAFERLIADGLIGRTERELAIALEYDMRRRGAERPSFPSIIAAGAHGALPHAQPREVEVGRGDLVVIDWGARARRLLLRLHPDRRCRRARDGAREIYELVLEAQLAGLQAVRSGRGRPRVDSVARDVIEAAGHGSNSGMASATASDSRSTRRRGSRTLR